MLEETLRRELVARFSALLLRSPPCTKVISLGNVHISQKVLVPMHWSDGITKHLQLRFQIGLGMLAPACKYT